VKDFDLRSAGKDSTIGQAATVGSPYLEFQRKFGTNKEDATDFTHGIAQMLTLINHPRLLTQNKALEAYLKAKPAATPNETIEWLYLNTLSRRPDDIEISEAVKYVQQVAEPVKAYTGVLWMLVNRSEYMLIR
jgi:hypothetical protein